jgi:ATP dependent DNA ligase-like protein
MAAHPQEAAIVVTILADEDRLHRRLHVVVDTALACALEQDERPVVGIERHLLRLARIGAHALDLLELDGADLRRKPIEKRKRTLAELLRKSKPGLQLNEQFEEPGDVLFRHACAMGLEGIVSKRKGLTHRSGRSALDQVEESRRARFQPNGRRRVG